MFTCGKVKKVMHRVIHIVKSQNGLKIVVENCRNLKIYTFALCLLLIILSYQQKITRTWVELLAIFFVLKFIF